MSRPSPAAPATDAPGDALLTLAAWLSPAYPVGAFSYSHGFETAIAAGAIADAATLAQWIADTLEYGAGRTDAILLAHAWRDPADDSIADLARALAPSAERLRETLEQGTALARTVGAITGRDLPPRALPVALAEAAQGLALSPSVIVALYLQGFVGNLVTIAVRHVPLGQTAGQALLARLSPVLAALADSSVEATLDDLGGSALAAELAAFEHETQDTRIFRT